MAAHPDHLRTLRDLLRYAVTRFAQQPLSYGHGQADAFDEAAFLMVRGLQLPFERMEMFLDAALTDAEIASLVDLIERRIGERMPAAYLLGEAWLQGYRFQVDSRVLVPRSLIGELLKDELRPWVDDPAGVNRVLDLCTGSGCLAIMAADLFARAHVDGADISPDALTVAARNVADYQLQERLQLIQSDLFGALGSARYDLILSNPPYVTDRSVAELPPEYRHEPLLGLAAGADGLDIVRRIVAGAKRHLTPDGLLIVEVGDGRAAVEAQYPELPLVWASTHGGDDLVFIARAQDLP